MALPDLPPPDDAPPERPASEPRPLSNDRRRSEEIDTALVRRLADILTETDLSEIQVERGELKIRVARQAALAAAPALVAAPAMMAALPAAAAPQQAAPAPAASQGETLKGDQVKSPMVGTVYLQPQPGAKAFVQPGDTVSAGQTLLIVEAMKTMNPIPAPRGGVVTKLLVEDGQPVEFGEPLAIIE